MKVNHWSLPNGATCVVAEMEDSTLTCIDFWCRGGSANESKDEEGMAHFLEHMIFKGSKNLTEGEFDLKIESLGGSSNASTGLDDVHFYILIPPENLGKALKLLFDLLLFPEIKKEAFEVEKQVVLEEIAQNFDQPDEILYMKFFKQCCAPHRYSKPILGFKQTVENFNPNQMRLFHQKNYVGRNCTLSIAGEIPEDIYKIIKNSKLKEFKNSKENITIKPLINFKKGIKKELIKRLEGGRILKAWELPPAKEQFFILGAEIVTTLLCEGKSSIMVKRFREELRIIESIEMDLQILELGGLVLLDICCPINNLEKVNNEINNTLNNLIINKLPYKELERAKKLVANNIYFSTEISSQIASITGNQALWQRHQPILDPIKNLDYWTSNRLEEEILPLFNPMNSYTLIAEPEINL